MINTVSLKLLFKKTIPFLPGYHSLCLVLRKLNTKKLEWIYRIPIKPGTPVLVHSKVGDFYLSHPERCSIAKKYFWTQGVREPVEDRIALNLFASLSKDSNIILDIGANSGLFSLVAAKANPTAKIMAFDILPEAYHILIDNLILNNLLEKVEVNLTGIGKADGVFYAPFNNILTEMPSSLSLDGNIKYDDQLKVQIPITSLDKICLPWFGEKSMCIKIDVEGTENDIFSHGLKTLEVIKPDIICEVLRSAKQYENYDEILDNLSYYKYLDEGFKRFDKIKPDLHFKDWFFTTKSNFNIPTEELFQ
jgi:FkbM family methyltransferase